MVSPSRPFGFENEGHRPAVVGWPAVRRLLRILIDALTILSLLFCLASAGLWVRSYWRGDDVGRAGGRLADGSRVYIGGLSGGGGLAVGAIVESPAVRVGPLPGGWHWYAFGRPPVPYPLGAEANRWGFGWNDHSSNGIRRRVIVFPLWLPTALCVALPLARGALFIRRRRRISDGHCSKCGYDLRATPDRCPECGTAAGGSRSGPAGSSSAGAGS